MKSYLFLIGILLFIKNMLSHHPSKKKRLWNIIITVQSSSMINEQSKVTGTLFSYCEFQEMVLKVLLSSFMACIYLWKNMMCKWLICLSVSGWSVIVIRGLPIIHIFYECPKKHCVNRQKKIFIATTPKLLHSLTFLANSQNLWVLWYVKGCHCMKSGFY